MNTPPPGLEGLFLYARDPMSGLPWTPPVGLSAGVSRGTGGPCVASYKRDMISAVYLKKKIRLDHLIKYRPAFLLADI
jgi:hypothetical protein